MLKISVKNLSEFSLPDACPKCLWVKNRLSYKYPFGMFPGIFSTIDGYSKKVTGLSKITGFLSPKCLEDTYPGCKQIPVPDWRKFKATLNDVEFRGKPDDLLVKEDTGHLFIPDYKTSKYRGADDRFAALYDTQLNCYGYIAEQQGHSLDKLALVYYEPQAEPELSDVLSDDTISMRFVVHIREVPIDFDGLAKTIDKAKSVLLGDMPLGVPGCKDCGLLDKVVDLLTQGPLSDAIINDLGL